MEVQFTPEEQALFESEAIIYSIIRCLEVLEKAYLNEKIDEDEYHSNCKRLIGQYKTISQGLDSRFPGLVPFCAANSLTTLCSLAIQRLKLGMTEAEINSASTESDTTAVIKVIESLITASDSIQMGSATVEDLHPRIQKIVTSLHRVKGLPTEYRGTERMLFWLETLNGMRAYEELSEEQMSELGHDIERARREFKQYMQA